MIINNLPVNPANQEQMARYMKNHFPFLGLQAPERKALSKGAIQDSRQLTTSEVLGTIAEYYQLPEREYQYIGIDTAIANVKRFSLTEVLSLADYVSKKAWWDSVDAWRKFFWLRVKAYPEELLPIFEHFYHSQDFWQRRVGINLQLLAKEQTNLELLQKAILKDRETDEFFIQKAIGWSLRQYSKTDPHWVRAFIKNNALSKLATTEGSKYL